MREGLIEHLEHVLFYSELRGDNPFKIRAYKKGLEIIEALSETELKKRLSDQSLTELDGIGKGLAALMQSFAQSGSSPELDDLLKVYPLSLAELRDVRGLGAKKIKSLFEELQISSLGELEYACHENRLLSLTGFGEKTQSKILLEIAQIKQRRSQMLLSEALKLAAQIESSALKKHRFERVGSLGRMLEIVERITYLVGASPSSKLSFESPTVKTPIEFIYEPNESRFIFESVRLTSSDAHFLSLQEIAKSKKQSLEELTAKATTVKDFYQALDLDEYSPECREFAVTAKPYNLVLESDLTGVFHFHTTASDGRHSLLEMAKAASQKRYQFIGLSDHSQTAFYAQGLKADALKKQRLEIQETESQTGIKILAGVESDILKDGSLDYSDAELSDLDFVIASVHSRYGATDLTSRILKAIENKYTSMIGHLTGRLILSREPYDLDFEQIVDAAIRHRVAIELNANPQRLDIDWRHLAKAAKKGLLIAINPDAHAVEGFDDVQYGIAMARKSMIDKKQIINTWPLTQIEDFLRS